MTKVKKGDIMFLSRKDGKGVFDNMSKFLKKIISLSLTAIMLFALVVPLSAGAFEMPMFVVSVYTEGGGDILCERPMYNMGEIVNISAVPNEGYVFYCWISDDVVFENPASQITRFVMPAKNVEIRAVFAIAQNVAQNTVSVTFDTMGGSEFAPVEFSVGAMCPEPTTVPTKQGYVFEGWYADSLCTLPFDFSSPIYASTFAYAKWSPVIEEVKENTFSDVKESDWFYKHVMSLAEKNIISGMGKNASGVPYFAPKANITRAQFVTILSNMAGDNLYKETDVSAIFDDVKNDAWYADAVAWAYSTGVASGTGNKTFSPEKNITRQDMAVMISNYAAKVAKITLSDDVARVDFADSKQISDYAVASVEAMQRAGIISGRGGNLFAPRAFATRAETSKMIDVLLTMIN